VAAPVALASGGGGSPTTPRAAHTASASGTTIRGAIHNPAHSSFTRTTGMFANSNTWAIRLANTGLGGAAIAECHATGGQDPCLNSDNHGNGLAFLFDTGGTTGGEILLTSPNDVPFTTNAHGVATGLNANYLQGKQASEFQLANKPAADSEKLAGQPATAYVGTGQLLFADVAKGPTLQSTRGATAVTQSGTEYTVTFGTSDVGTCSFTASPSGGALASGQLGVAPSTTHTNEVVVSAPTGFEGGFDLQVVC